MSRLLFIRDYYAVASGISTKISMRPPDTIRPAMVGDDTVYPQMSIVGTVHIAAIVGSSE